MAEKASQDAKDSPSVPWSDAIRFVRQLSHDLRNDLNAIELQSAYIAELEKNEELQGEIKRLREMVSRLASTLQRLSRDVGEVKPTLIFLPGYRFHGRPAQERLTTISQSKTPKSPGRFSLATRC